LLRTNLHFKDVSKAIPSLLNTIFKNIPSGLGSKGKLNINYSELDEVLDNGLNWALDNDYAIEEDIEHWKQFITRL